MTVPPTHGLHDGAGPSQRITRTTAPSKSFGLKHTKLSSKGLVPGPGAYHPTVKLGAKDVGRRDAPHFSFGGRGILRVAVPTAGGGGAAASPRKKKTRIASVSPGPGAYEVPVTIGKTDATRFASVCVHSAPAPSMSGRQVPFWFVCCVDVGPPGAFLVCLLCRCRAAARCLFCLFVVLRERVD